MKGTTNFKNILFLGSALLVVACTKKSPYEYELKENVLEKSVIDTEAEYLYVPSLMNSSRTSDAARPYWLGEQKRIKFQFTENSLQVTEIEIDQRFKDNAANNKLVMEIPINHIEYRCALDKYKECTNKEEQNNELNWAQRSKFKPNFENVSITEANVLPLEVEKLFGGGCYQQVAAKFAGYKFDNQALNFEIEKTFKVDIDCASKLESLGDLTVTAVYHYSFAKLSVLASTNYEAIGYSNSDQREFGFFATETTRLDVDNSSTIKSDTTFLNRWNPEKEIVTYYLSKEFNKPENALLKVATEKAFAKLNLGLEQAGLKFRLELKDGEGRNVGDIRNNFIVMVEDPIDSGLLGYGPTVTDPTTGEILSGRTVMYPGVMKQFIKSTYNEIFEAHKKEKLAELAKQNLASGDLFKLSKKLQTQLQSLKPKAQSVDGNAQAEETDENTTSGAPSIASGNVSGVVQKNTEVAATPSSELTMQESSASNAQNEMQQAESQIKPQVDKQETALTTDQMIAELDSANSNMNFKKEIPLAIEHLKTELLGKKMAKEQTLSAKDRIALMSKYCTYPAELFNFDQAISNSLKLNLGGDLKEWAQMSDDEKQKTIDIILPEIWIPTLVHEMGHNLGLRHNFKGSEDKDNFYSKEELHEHGVNIEIPYSSVMDYPYSDLNALPSMGKYDIAALKFAYLRQVTDENGQAVKVETSIEDLLKNHEGLRLKSFGYCTDENVEVNVGCKRFDLGTTLTEMVQNQIQSYEESYKKRNFRNLRKSFSLVRDGAVANQLLGLMSYMRFNFETMSNIKERYDLDYESSLWEEYEFLKDLKNASLLSAEFLLKIIAEPELTCVIASESNNEIVAVVPIKDIDAEQISCEKVKLKDGFKVVGSFGKLINSAKDPESDNPYMDQIDVRGNWIAKLAAFKTLVDRKINNSSYDKTEDTYIDIPLVRKQLLKQMADFVRGDAKAFELVTLNNGQALELPFTKDFTASAVIAQPLSESAKQIFGMPNREVRLQELLVSRIKRASLARALGDKNDDSALKDMFTVSKFSALNKISKIDGEGNQVALLILAKDDLQYVATPRNLLGREFIAKAQVARELAAFEKGDIEQALLKIINNQMPKPKKATAVEKTVAQFDPRLVIAYLNDEIQSSEYIFSILDILAQ